MITIKERSFEISASLRHIGYEKDNLVETRTFCIKNKELFEMEFFIDLENTLESNLLEKAFSADGNEMFLTWNISSGCLKKPGVITFQLRGVDAEGEKVWHSTKDYFLSGNSIDAYSDVTEDEANSFIQLEKNVVALKNETQVLSDSARESSLKSQEYSENASALCDELREDYNGFKEELYTKDEVDEKLENKSNKQTVTAHTENLKNPHGVTAEQVGAYPVEKVYTKDEVDEKLENKSNKQTVTAHTENLKNPHGVTAEQVGAYTKDDIDFKLELFHSQLFHKIYHNEIDSRYGLTTDVLYLYNAENKYDGDVYDKVPFRTATIFNKQPCAMYLSLPIIIQTAIADDGLIYVREIKSKYGASDEYDFTVPWECKTYTKEEVDEFLTEKATVTETDRRLYSVPSAGLEIVDGVVVGIGSCRDEHIVIPEVDGEGNDVYAVADGVFGYLLGTEGEFIKSITFPPSVKWFGRESGMDDSIIYGVTCPNLEAVYILNPKIDWSGTDPSPFRLPGTTKDVYFGGTKKQWKELNTGHSLIQLSNENIAAGIVPAVHYGYFVTYSDIEEKFEAVNQRVDETYTKEEVDVRINSLIPRATIENNILTINGLINDVSVNNNVLVIS